MEISTHKVRITNCYSSLNKDSKVDSGPNYFENWNYSESSRHPFRNYVEIFILKSFSCFEWGSGVLQLQGRGTETGREVILGSQLFFSFSNLAFFGFNFFIKYYLSVLYALTIYFTVESFTPTISDANLFEYFSLITRSMSQSFC